MAKRKRLDVPKDTIPADLETKSQAITPRARMPIAEVASEVAGRAALEEVASPDAEGKELLLKVADRFGLSARGYHRVLRVARTIADLDGSETVRKPHVAEAVGFRLALSKEV